MITVKPVKTFAESRPARVPAEDGYQYLKALGAAPTPMAFSEAIRHSRKSSRAWSSR